MFQALVHFSKSFLLGDLVSAIPVYRIVNMQVTVEMTCVLKSFQIPPDTFQVEDPHM